MRHRARLLALLLPIAALLSMQVTSGSPAAHAAVGGVGEADGGGVLPRFPCYANCTTAFTGFTSGNGTFEFPNGTQTMTGNLTWEKLPLTGAITYSDGVGTYCPWWGGAQPSNLWPNNGTLSFDSRTAANTVSGAVYSSAAQQGGNVLNVWGTYVFKWTRVGATAEVEIGGTVSIQYWLPGMGSTYGVLGPVNWSGKGAFAFALTTPTAVQGCIGTAATNVGYTTAGTFNILG